MDTQKRLFRFITRLNWILFALTTFLGFVVFPADFVRGIFCGGLIVTVNFHLLSRTLKKALTPPNIASHNVILMKYYIRFAVSAVIIFFLIKTHFVHPIGLLIGLSVVVASIMTAAACEIKNLIFKEAI